ncbi:hypothetical protein L9F63_021699, partial [Diploptera punctata]
WDQQPILVGILCFLLMMSRWQEVVASSAILGSGAEDVYRFAGNETHVDYFRLVLREGNSLLIGGR